MATLQITLPDETTTAARTRAADGGFPSYDAHVAGLIEADAAVPVSAAVEAELLASLDGPGQSLAAADWDRKRQELAARQRRAQNP